MNKSLKRIVGAVFLILISLTFTECQQDDNLNQSKTSDILLAQKWFENYENNSNNYTLFQNLEYKWSDAKIKNSEDGTETIIIPVIINQDYISYQQKLYIYRLDKNIYKALLFEIYPDQKSTTKDNSFESGNFNGYISAWDLKQGFVKAAKFVNDKVVENGFINVYEKSNKATNKAPNLPPCPAGTYCGDGDSGGDDEPIKLNEVVINNNYQSPTIYYLVYYSGGGTITDTGTGAYTNHSAGNGITVPTPVEIIDQLTGKAKCLNALLNKNGNSFVQKLLANFAGKSEFNIKIISKDIVTNKDEKGTIYELNGITRYDKLLNPSLISIEISTSRSEQQSALDAARTILHEYIHADIIRKLYTKENIPGAFDFKNDYEKYGSQHGTIAGLYLASMRDALKEFHKNVLTDDYNKYINYYGETPSDVFYEALAWGGLKENNVKAWTDLKPEQKAEIEKLASRNNLLSKKTPCP